MDSERLDQYLLGAVPLRAAADVGNTESFGPVSHNHPSLIPIASVVTGIRCAVNAQCVYY